MKKTLILLIIAIVFLPDSEANPLLVSKAEIIKEERESFKFEQINRTININDSYHERMRAFQEQKNKNLSRLNNGLIDLQIPLIWYTQKFD